MLKQVGDDGGGGNSSTTVDDDNCGGALTTPPNDGVSSSRSGEALLQPPPPLRPPPPPSPSSSTATQYSDAPISASPYSSNSVGGGISNTSSHSATVFSALSSNLMRAQQKRDPLVIYEVLEILGKGSMGSVSRVRKREEAVGGSARPQFVQKHYTPRGKNAWHNCWLRIVHHVGTTCPFSPIITINNNVFVNTENSNNTNNSSHPSDLTVSNRKSNVNRNRATASPMSSYNETSVDKARLPSCGSRRRHHKHRTMACICLKACFGRPINDDPIAATTHRTSDDIGTNHANTSITSRHSNHLQPSSMIVRNSDDAKKTKKKTSSSTFYALKSIHLSRCSSPEYQLELKNEVEILKTLDHPNIVRAIETFDYRNRLFIVLELCSGGDLYTREPYTEAAAKCICKSLFSAVAYLHSKDIIHRDLKFENAMFVDERSDQIKIIDFGLSQKFASSNGHLHDPVGTVYTMAPELLAGDYNNKADVWSLGVISFMLLSSSMPFFGKSRVRVMKKILKGKYQFSSRRWTTVSGDAMRFVADCLTMKPEVRPSAEEALHLQWLSSSSDNLTPCSSPPELDQMDQVQACMQAFAHYSMLKKLALMVVAYKSTSDEIGFLRGMFEKYDVHEHGEISLSDFKEALSTSYDYSDFELEDMFHGIDVDGAGTIQYSEFLAATIEAHGFIDEERLAEAFDRIDTDDDGYITVDNLRDFLGNDVPAAYLEEIIDEANWQGTRRVSYQEFVRLWNDEDDEILSQARSQVKSRHLTPQCSVISSVSSYGSMSEFGGTDSEDNDRFAAARAASLAAVFAMKNQPQEAGKETSTLQEAAQHQHGDGGAADAKPHQKAATISCAFFNQRRQMSMTKSMRRTLVHQPQQPQQPHLPYIDDTGENDGAIGTGLVA